LAQGEVSIGRKLLAEFMGSAFLVIAAISPTILANDVLHAEPLLAVLSDSLAVAFVLFALIEALGPVSGCHINPAVTLSMFVAKKIDIGTGIEYVAVQVAGGIVGTMCSHLMYYHINPILLTISGVERSGGCFFAEFLGTFFLLMVIYGCSKNNSRVTSLAVALVVGGLLLTTSSTMFANPAVTIARMFTYAMAGIEPSDAAIFVFAQFLGSLAATGLSLYLYSPPKDRALVNRSSPMATDGS
jgi:glycerol uptake facilitator-like aquaporin